jgi:hypothetical protein
VSREAESHRGLLVGLALGAPLMAYGVRGALVDASLTHPFELARWVVGSALAHDLVLAPAVLAVGWAAHRTTPRPAWPAVRWGLVTTGVLALLAWPFVRGYGRDPNIPSLLPRDYAAGTAVAVAVVWAAVVIAVVVAYRRRRGRVEPGAGPEPTP